VTRMESTPDPSDPKNPRPMGGGEGEECTCHLPGSTYPTLAGGIDPDCPKHNPT